MEGGHILKQTFSTSVFYTIEFINPDDLIQKLSLFLRTATTNMVFYTILHLIDSP